MNLPFSEEAARRQDHHVDLREMARYRTNWKQGFSGKTMMVLEEERVWWEEMIIAHPEKLDEDLKILEEIDARIAVLRDRVIRQGEAENPLAFCAPTWEQAQFINSWSPEFDSEKAPNGYNSTANFGGKRSLKTTASVLSAILWAVPNDPEWEIFREREDPYGRGKYRVLRRPMFDVWQRSGTMTYDDTEPPVQGRQIWHGCVDEAHWKTKIDKQYRRWMPMRFIKVHADGKSYMWNLTDRYFETLWGVRVTGMLYKSDIQAWGGEELFLTVFDEGPPRAVVDEVVSRSLYIAWTYTPAEAANTSDRVQVAREVYEGKLQLVGQTYIVNSSMMKVPDDIIPAAVKEKRRATLSTRGEAGRIAMEGGFFDDSPRVFDLFDRNRHVLPILGRQVVEAINREISFEDRKRLPWLSAFEDANIFRGFDEGFVHPSACIWMALLRTGERVVFRELAVRATSINERVERIVALSGNELKEHDQSPGGNTALLTAQMFYDRTIDLERDQDREQKTGTKAKRFFEFEKREVVRDTLGDPKLFKRDPQYLLETWGDVYRRAGLRINKAAQRMPEERCNFTNGMFRQNPSRTHLNPAQATDEAPFGYDLYLTADCPELTLKLERYLWQQISTGQNAGQFTGKPEEKDDDLIDGLCYVTNHKISWVPQDEIRERHESQQAA